MLFHIRKTTPSNPIHNIRFLMPGCESSYESQPFSESFIKLIYTPPRQGTAASLAITDWWTPYTDDQRTADAPIAPRRANLPTASNFRAYAFNAMEGWDDMDLGSGGPVLV